MPRKSTVDTYDGLPLTFRVELPERLEVTPALSAAFDRAMPLLLRIREAREQQRAAREAERRAETPATVEARP